MEKVFYRKKLKVNSSSAVFNTVLEWLDQGFATYATSTALRFSKDRLSYDELDKFSNRIANYLISQGVNKGDRVGICLDRSPEMIASIVGILKAGAAYVPLDPNYPIDRLKMMREDARLCLLLTHEKYSDRYEGTNPDRVVAWEDIDKIIEQYPDLPSSNERDIAGEDIAYVIFTSGSTGRPKGIKMPHRALANLIEWQLERDYFKKEARVLQYSSISFDVSFQEIATTLASGGTLFLVKDEERRDPRLLLDSMNYFKIERLFIPFVALRSLVEMALYTGTLPESLNEVITAGEQLRVDSDLRSFFSKLQDTILENQYGPSETHVISAHLLDADPSKWPDLPPIGKPIKNNSIYILDENMKPVEAGDTGELYLAGQNVACGYIGRDDLSRKSFIDNPFDVPNQPVVYKTGDLGFYNGDGVIEFLGRADHQIKIRGYRVEPGEINTIGAKYPGISQCITHAVQEEDNNSRLVTYYVVQKDCEVSKDSFKTYLSETLPEYMVPAFVMELTAIPYTPSGKVDLKSLPKPQNPIPGATGKEVITYQSETEAVLSEIWGELLGHDNIPRTSNFFDLGGDSLNAFTLFIKIDKRFGRNLPLSSLLQAPTIEALAKTIDHASGDLDFSRFRSLQLIQKGSLDKTPIFLVHGGAGNVLMFKDLVNGLPPDQPIYAFQWPGWDGYKGEKDITEMAKFYISEMREVWPEGPYRLGGHCIGGIIAIEMAKLLKDKGAEIKGPLLVSDAPNLYSKHFHSNEPEVSNEEKDRFNRVAAKLNSCIARNAGELNIQGAIKNKEDEKRPDIYSTRRFPKLAKYLPLYFKLGRAFLKFQSKVQLLRIFILEKLSLKIPVKDRHRYSTLSQLAAIKKHHKSIYEGDILYLKSDVMHGRKMGLQGWWEDIYFGFEELCWGNFDAHVIGGDHNDVLKHSRAHQIIREKMFGIDG